MCYSKHTPEERRDSHVPGGVLICAVSVAVFKIAAFFMGPLIQSFCKHIAEPMLANRD